MRIAATTVLNDTRDPTRTQAAAACRLAADTPGLADGSLPSLGSLQLFSTSRSGDGGDPPPLPLLLSLSLRLPRVAAPPPAVGIACCRCCCRCLPGEPRCGGGACRWFRWVAIGRIQSPAGLLQLADAAGLGAVAPPPLPPSPTPLACRSIVPGRNETVRFIFGSA